MLELVIWLLKNEYTKSFSEAYRMVMADHTEALEKAGLNENKKSP